ncbi:hypothetical protein ACA910_018997 [Epithemia clementina (nom. ined.)]
MKHAVIVILGILFVHYITLITPEFDLYPQHHSASLTSSSSGKKRGASQRPSGKHNSWQQPGKSSWNELLKLEQRKISPTILQESIQMAHQRQTELRNGIQRIYYINLDKNYRRREQMEWHLSRLEPRIPHDRFAALYGTLNGTACIAGKQNPLQCRGISGLARSVIQLMDSYNMSGISLVLEDDFAIATNLTKIQQAIDRVPEDWDIIRLVPQRGAFRRHPQAVIPVEPKQQRSLSDDDDMPILNISRIQEQIFRDRKTFCGGTHAMVWRESSLAKLHRAWSRRPYEDIDCALSREPGLRSYIIGHTEDQKSTEVFGKLNRQIEGERTDIPSTPKQHSALLESGQF